MDFLAGVLARFDSRLEMQVDAFRAKVLLVVAVDLVSVKDPSLLLDVCSELLHLLLLGLYDMHRQLLRFLKTLYVLLKSGLRSCRLNRWTESALGQLLRSFSHSASALAKTSL